MQNKEVELILNKLQTGDVIFTTNRSPASKLIQMVQGDMPYSHVCIYLGSNIIATTGGNNFYNFGFVDATYYINKQKSVAIGRYTTIDEYGNKNTLTTLQTQVIIKKCCDFKNAKTPYGTTKIIKGAWNNYADGYFWNKEDKENKTLFCSESVTKAFAAAGIDLKIGSGKLNAESMTPENLYRSRNSLNIIYDSLKL